MPAAMSQANWGIDDGHDVADKPTRGKGTNGGALSGKNQPRTDEPRPRVTTLTRTNPRTSKTIERIIHIYTYTYIYIYLYASGVVVFVVVAKGSQDTGSITSAELRMLQVNLGQE